MRKLYEKSEIAFALVWIGIYVVLMNIALQFGGGFDGIAEKSALEAAVPFVCALALAVCITAWILKNGLAEKYGLCRFKGSAKAFLWFVPLAVMSCINLKNGLSRPATWTVSLLTALNMATAGYVEEIIFRGFLFRAMAKDNIKSAVIVSAVTFGAGHIVNIFNTADIAGVLIQICYAIAIGFLYTVIVWKGGSLWPCIASHVFVNATSVFAAEEGAFTRLAAAIFGNATDFNVQLLSAVTVIIIAGGYTLWLLKKNKNGTP